MNRGQSKRTRPLGWGLQFGSIEARPVFRDYWERVSDRDTFRRANELDDKAMQ